MNTSSILPARNFRAQPLTWLTILLMTWLGLLAPAASAQSCAAPGNVTASPTPLNSVDVSFTPVASAVNYTVRCFWTGDSTAAGTIIITTTTSPVTIGNLRPGAHYVVYVTSNCAGGGTATSPWQTFQAQGNGGGPGPGACTAPTNISVTSPSATTAVVSFSPVATATSYTVRYFWTGDSTAAGMMSQTVTSSPATLSGLRPSAYYVVRVTSNCANGGTANSTQHVFQTSAGGALACGPVSGVWASGTATMAYLNFTPVSGALNYTVRYHAVGDTVVHTVTVTGSSTQFTGLTPSTSYVATIVTNCANGTASAPVNASFSTAPLTANTCEPPTNVTVTPGLNSVVVSFSPSATVVSYTVRYYWTGDSTASGTTSLNTNSSPVVLNGLVGGATYVVYVVGNCANGTMVFSPSVRFNMPGGGPSPCAAPTNLHTNVATASFISLGFTPAPGALGYRVEYYPVGSNGQAQSFNTSGSPVTFGNLQPATSYTVNISTICGSGNTSAIATTTMRTQDVCGNISNITVTASSDSTALLNFVPGTGNTSFQVMYWAVGDSTHSHYLTSTQAPITLGGLVAGNTYIIRIMSLCGGVSTPATSGVTYHARVLATRAALGGGRINVYPNPAQRAASLELPAMPGAVRAQISLLNALGQVVRSFSVGLSSATTHTHLDLLGVAPGLYTLRVQAGGQVATQRLAVE
jgi:hypothetical protein